MQLDGCGTDIIEGIVLNGGQIVEQNGIVGGGGRLLLVCMHRQVELVQFCCLSN